MNKLILTAVIACGLLLLDIPEAAAHERGHGYKKKHYSYPVVRHHHSYRQYAYKPVRSTKMPKWLKRDKSFRHWFERSALRRDRQLSWSQLFDIYRWEYSHYRYRRY